MWINKFGFIAINQKSPKDITEGILFTTLYHDIQAWHYRGTTTVLRLYRRGLPRFNRKKIPYRGNAVNEMPPRSRYFWVQFAI
jgi:hypothetical protein